MSIVALIPIKSKSKRIDRKNFRIFDGFPLYEHFFRKLTPTHPFDTVYVDTDSQEVTECALSYGFEVIERPEWLARDTANGNDLLLYEAEQVVADVYVQLFVTAPLLEPATIKRACELINDPDHDSVLTAKEIRSWFWFDGRPVNYDPQVLPRSQDARPIVQETTGLYAIEREALLQRRCRIGYRPHFLIVDEWEAIDLDTELDFRMASLFGR